MLRSSSSSRWLISSVPMRASPEPTFASFTLPDSGGASSKMMIVRPSSMKISAPKVTSALTAFVLWSFR